MCPEKQNRLTAAQVLQKYTDDGLPDFLDRPIQDVNQVGIDGDRPIHVACVRRNFDDVVALIEAGPTSTLQAILDMHRCTLPPGADFWTLSKCC
jgi:ankyrin repeat protein